MQIPTTFAQKQVTVMGLGLNGGGVDMVQFLLAEGAHVCVTDRKDAIALAPALAALGTDASRVRFVLGMHREEDFTNADVVIKNPRVPWDDPLIVAAQSAGVPVIMDAAIFAVRCTRPFIGITGSKGKTTTTYMIAHLLSVANREHVLVGVGQTPVVSTLARIAATPCVPVMELSSWRLSGMDRVARSPHIAVVTNILRDHADYYPRQEEYVADKYAITAHQTKEDVLIVNDDDPVLTKWGTQTAARVVRVSVSRDPGGDALFVRGGHVVARRGEGEEILFAVTTPTMIGRHALYDACLASAAALEVGVTAAQIAKGIALWRGVPHRYQIVATIEDVRYINDTTATIPDAAIASMRATQEPLVLIAGGTDKNLIFDAFVAEMCARARAIVFLPGTATDKIRAALDRVATHPPYSVAQSMNDAIAYATEYAQKGDTVLLSPGAASFGLFANEFDRGTQFCEAVHRRMSHEC